MPAIQPARLKKQTGELADNFNEPAIFIRKLFHFFEYYSERTQRPGQSGEPPALIDAFYVRHPVLRQVVHELTPLVETYPLEAVELCDVLWQQPYLEFKILAANLLGKIPEAHFDHVIERVTTRVIDEKDDQVINVLLTDGLSSVREVKPAIVLDLAKKWFSDNEIKHQRLGLQTIIPLIRDQNYDLLPVIFQLIQPYALRVPGELQHYTLESLKALARLSPRETSYFLQNSLLHPDNVDTAWIIRRCIDDFPADIKSELKVLSRQKS